MFRACVECLTNQGSEFIGEFQDLLDHALIDHCQTLRDHPQADGLVERMVQTCKKGFLKDLPHWEQIRLGLGPTLHCHGL
jgi:hypothetical protein